MLATPKKSRNRAVAGPTRGVMVVSIVMALIALCGLADATYLTVMHLIGNDAVCGSSAGCSAVLGSVYATVKGIPTAAFGAVAYFVVFGAAICRAFGYGWAGRILTVTIISMFVATLGFLYLQAFVLHAFCPFCLFSAALTFLLAGILLASWPSR